METIRLPEVDVPIEGSFDVAVVGAGAAGFAAAIAAARAGGNVALIESEAMLGGNVGPGGVSTICGMHFVTEDGAIHRIVGGIAAEFVKNLENSGATIGPFAFRGSTSIVFNPWTLIRLCDEMVMAEKNIRLFLHARAIGVISENGSPAGLVIHQVGGLRALRASVIIDASGDAEVARMAGAETRRGERIMYPSAMFIMANADPTHIFWKDRALFTRLLDEHWDSGKYKINRREGALIPTTRPHEAAVSVTRITQGDRDDAAVDASDPDQLSLAQIEGRRQVDEMSRFIRENVPGFENAYVSCVSPRLGIRETRTIVGEYTLTGEDVLGAKHFPDAIAANSWPIEDHVPGGRTEWRELPRGQYYQAPYRCMVPQKIDGLLVAGRCMSTTHEALASSRTIALCMAAGEAAGVAALMAAQEKIPPRKISIARLQQTLKDNGAILERSVHHPQDGAPIPVALD